MMIIGVDYHPSFQAIAFFVEETGECGEQELNHSDGQAERFYRDLKQRSSELNCQWRLRVCKFRLFRNGPQVLTSWQLKRGPSMQVRLLGKSLRFSLLRPGFWDRNCPVRR
jgi:hypothetical protein